MRAYNFHIWYGQFWQKSQQNTHGTRSLEASFPENQDPGNGEALDCGVVVHPLVTDLKGSAEKMARSTGSTITVCDLSGQKVAVRATSCCNCTHIFHL